MDTYSQITDVLGIRVGHWTDLEAVTGCTVILTESGAAAGVDVRGDSPGTRETDLLKCSGRVKEVQAVLLSGGSAFGLASTDGVMKYLEDHSAGFSVGVRWCLLCLARYCSTSTLVMGRLGRHRSQDMRLVVLLTMVRFLLGMSELVQGPPWQRHRSGSPTGVL